MRHALIFAAGLGERMRPLTDRTPKPLLAVRGKPLVVWHLEKLAAIGVHYVVMNTSHLADQFPEALGNGSRWGLRIRYAYEGPVPLETGGGMLNALTLLGPEPFIAINGDIWTDADFSQLPAEPRGVAHLMLVDNPSHHPEGDFALDQQGVVHNDGDARLTFSGIGVYRRELLDNWRDVIGDNADANAKPPRFKIAPVLRAAINQGAITGTHYRGAWTDVGTPERLASLNATT
ncbi:N-acetylmuramate alpha-1-phosphate uridylyltransferase MurU [Dyella sp.]|uniref:N-acetylmuramate alpha-1-phosphate uridylyltransferase MurU n=1 Tax=Dyella sp. TaxID=1869338 RepID=UPI002C25ADB4|nr:nucleotidyltransferase family protein [Dyella sp.]HTC27016.1 nucleotidyltransferase family protein [Dyella sp.]